MAISTLVFALAAPYILLPIKEEQVLYLVDRSASMKGTEEEMASFIEESLQSKKRMSNLQGFILFLRHYKQKRFYRIH